MPTISFAPGVLSGGLLNGYTFVFDTVSVNGTVMNAATIAPLAVQSVTASPDPAWLNAGKVVAITVTMSAPVTVSGAPTLLLNDGAAATYDPLHSTSTQLVFTDTVASPEEVNPLAVNSIALNGGSITGNGGNADMSGVATSFPGLVIDTDPNEQAGLTLAFNDTLIGQAGAKSVHFTVGGLDPVDDTAVITFTDVNNKTQTATVSADGTATADLSGLADGTVTATMHVTDLATNSFDATSSNTADLDQDPTEAPTLSFNDTLVGQAGAKSVHFTVGGLDPADDTAVVTFKDANNVTATATVTGNGTSTADLSALTDGAITPVLAVVTDTAGNLFTLSAATPLNSIRI